MTRDDFDFFPFSPADGVKHGDRGFSLPALLVERIARKAFAKAAFFFTRRHLERLIAAWESPGASENDRFVLSMLLRNAEIAAKGKLPLCQDTGIATVFGFKDNGVCVSGSERGAFSNAVKAVYAENHLRFSTVLPRSFFDEYDPGDNLPAQVTLFSTDSDGAESAGILTGGPARFWEGPAYRLLFSAKGGGSSNKTRLIQGTKALLNPQAFGDLLRAEISAIGAAACPPYTIAVVAGGLSPEENLLALKLAVSGWYEAAPFRAPDLEAQVMEAARNTGVGAGVGGEAFCVDSVVIRLPRHGASFFVSLGVACSAHRVLNAVVTGEGWYLEKTVEAPRVIPGFAHAADFRSGESPVRINTRAGVRACLESLAGVPPGKRVLVSGPLLVARDAAHSRWKALVDAGELLPEYVSQYPILYAGPSGAPEGCVCGSIGPTTAGRMDAYAELLMCRGAGLITLAKGNRSPLWAGACKKYGACYLGVSGGCAALIAEEHAVSLSLLDYEDLGMEAVRLLEVKDLPAFVLIDCGGQDFYNPL